MKSVAHFNKSISLDVDDWAVITALQKRTRKDISKTISIIIKQWARINREVNLQKQIIKQDVDIEAAKLSRAKVIKQ